MIREQESVLTIVNLVNEFNSPNGTIFKLLPDGSKKVILTGQKQYEDYFSDLSRDLACQLFLDHCPNVNVKLEDVTSLTDEELLRGLILTFTGFHIGITNRNKEDVEDLVPGLIEKISKPGQKIAFVGNGISELPTLSLLSEVTVIDLFDYGILLEDFIALEDYLEKQGFSNIYASEIETLKSIVSSVNIKRYKYLFGLGILPEELIGRFDLVVNLFGPPERDPVLSEVLSLLKVSGEYLSSETKVSKR